MQRLESFLLDFDFRRWDLYSDWFLEVEAQQKNISCKTDEDDADSLPKLRAAAVIGDTFLKHAGGRARRSSHSRYLCPWRSASGPARGYFET